jgi:MFS family permease
MAIRIWQFLAVIFTALALVPGGAHLMELPAKIDLPEQPYFVVQQIYRGWAFSGAVIFAAILANFAGALVARHNSWQFWLSMIAGLLIAATLAVFFAWTYPANQATGNWTSAPENWEQLRIQWEYSHAINAMITFSALVCSVAAALSYPAPQRAAMRRAAAQHAD